MQPLILSRMTTLSCIGPGLEAAREALQAARSGLAPCRFETARLETWVGQVPDASLPAVPVGLSDYDCRNNRLAQACLEQDGFAEAVARARQRHGAHRIGLFLGTSTSGILETEIAYRHRDPRTGALPAEYRYAQRQNTYSLAAFVRAYLHLAGPSVVVSTACSSSAKVFGSAQRMLQAGLCDAAVVGGADSLCLTTLYGFSSLGLVSTQPCRPFDAERDGISLGEAAGFALLERAPPGADRGGVRLLGVGESSDAYHMSTPQPEGLGARLAMERALASATLTPDAVDYINLHGTGTRSNDASEEAAVHAVFGDAVPCSSTKGFTGHALGASGITEIIVCGLCIEHGLLPGSANTRVVDSAVRIDYLLASRSAQVEVAMSNSFGFGGTNCSVILGRAQ